MSKLGYIQESFGKQFNIAISNTYGYNVLGGNNLPSNTLIISSPVDEDNNDIGTYSLLVTDYLGTPIRLSYTIQEGNGLIYNNDSIELVIDNDTIVENNNQLSAYLFSLVDNDTIIVNEDKLDINLDNLNKISEDNRGLFKIDEKTIKSNEGELYVDTSSLNYANKNINSGIVIGDGLTINSENGILSVIQDSIYKSSKDNFGVVKGGNDTLNIENGVISVNTENLSKSNEIEYGIVKPDNITIGLNEKQELVINTQNLEKVSYTNGGIFKYDPEIFEINNDKLSIKNINKINEKLSNIKQNIDNLKLKIDDLNTLLSEYKGGIIGPMIFDFHCIDIPTGMFRKPNYLNEPISEMNFQYISVDFVVSTNCPFLVSIKIEDDINPQISLYEINYNNINKYYGNSGLLETYQSTNGEKLPIKITFIGKNYYSGDVSEYSKKVKINITISYVNDISIFKTVRYSIVRFNSSYNKEIIYKDNNIEIK